MLAAYLPGELLEKILLTTRDIPCPKVAKAPWALDAFSPISEISVCLFSNEKRTSKYRNSNRYNVIMNPNLILILSCYNYLSKASLTLVIMA